MPAGTWRVVELDTVDLALHTLQIWRIRVGILACLPFRTRSNAHGTAMMARATDRFQLSAMRVNVLQKCGLADFASFDMCTPEAGEVNLARLHRNSVTPSLKPAF